MVMVVKRYWRGHQSVREIPVRRGLRVRQVSRRQGAIGGPANHYSRDNPKFTQTNYISTEAARLLGVSLESTTLGVPLDAGALGIPLELTTLGVPLHAVALGISPDTAANTLSKLIIPQRNHDPMQRKA